MSIDVLIYVRDLQKSYNNHKVLNNISFDVRRGECFCLLGPNGAGKTTTLKILTGFLKADSGTVEIFGKDIRSNLHQSKRKVSIIPQYPALDPLLTVKENLIFFALLQKIPKFQMNVIVNDLLNFFGLDKIKDRMAFHCSGGEYQRLMVARAFLKKNDLIFMDEPTAGIDLLFKNRLWNYFNQLKKAGTTFFLNTHDLNEAEVLSDRIGFIFGGCLLVIDTPDKLKQIIEGITINVQFLQPVSDTLLTRIKTLIKNEISSVGSNKIIIRTRHFSLEILSALTIIAQDNPIVSIDTQASSLNDIFMELGAKNAGHHLA